MDKYHHRSRLRVGSWGPNVDRQAILGHVLVAVLRRIIRIEHLWARRPTHPGITRMRPFDRRRSRPKSQFVYRRSRVRDSACSHPSGLFSPIFNVEVLDATEL